MNQTEALCHSVKGSTWKKHKYNRKDGKRYFYDDDTNTVEDLTGIESPDFQGLADEMGKIPAVSKLREIMDGPMPIYSPNKNEESLVSKAQDAIEDAIDKNKEKRLAKQRRKNMQSDHQAYLEHSSGPWKKHKYFQKIGEGANAVYKYAKSVPGRMTGEYYDKEADKYNDEYWDHVDKSAKADEKQGPAVRGTFDYLTKANLEKDPNKRRFYRKVSGDYARDYDRAYREQQHELEKADAARDKRDENWRKSYNAPVKKAKRAKDKAESAVNSAMDKAKERVKKAKAKLKHDGMDDYAAIVEYGEALIDQMFGRE